MKPTTKQADWATRIPAYAAIGGGGFALGALLNEVRRQQASEQQRKRQQLPPNALVIDVPRQAGEEKHAFLKQADGMIGNFVDHSLSAAIGAPAGFLGAKLLYDRYKKKQTDGEIDQANQKYLQALAALQQKSASVVTPNVDAFCKSAAETLEKQAGVVDSLKGLVAPAVGAAKGLGSRVGGFAKGLAGRGADMVAQHPGKVLAGAGIAAGANDLLGSRSPVEDGNNLLKKLFYSTLVLSGLGTAGAMVHASNKQDRRGGPGAPSAVALNYEDMPPAATLQ